VKFNFGPTFKYPPKTVEFKPCTDLVDIVLAEKEKERAEQLATQPQNGGLNNGVVTPTATNGVDHMDTVKTETEPVAV
jgi:hypothetical protein